MDNELFNELKWHIETALDDRQNPKEVMKTLAALVDHVADFYMEK